MQNFLSFLFRFSAVQRAEGRAGGRDGEDEADGGVDEAAGRGDETERRTPLADDPEAGRGEGQERGEPDRHVRGEDWPFPGIGRK